MSIVGSDVKPLKIYLDENTYAYVGDERKMLIEAKAAEIMQTGVKFKDACHVASAVYAKCEYFISTDKRLLKYKSEAIKMVSPIEFIIEMEETLYDGKHDWNYEQGDEMFDAASGSNEASLFEKSHPFTGEAIRL